MKTTILTLLTIVLVTTGANGQSTPLQRQYKKMPITDTCYLYTEKQFTNSDGKIYLWQTDLQTGFRYEVDVNCLPKDSIPVIGSIVRTLRSKMIIEPKTKRRRNA